MYNRVRCLAEQNTCIVLPGTPLLQGLWLKSWHLLQPIINLYVLSVKTSHQARFCLLNIISCNFIYNNDGIFKLWEFYHSHPSTGNKQSVHIVSFPARHTRSCPSTGHTTNLFIHFKLSICSPVLFWICGSPVPPPLTSPSQASVVHPSAHLSSPAWVWGLLLVGIYPWSARNKIGILFITYCFQHRNCSRLKVMSESAVQRLVVLCWSL